jgi:hypothetical protein
LSLIFHSNWKAWKWKGMEWNTPPKWSYRERSSDHHRIAG